jgi:hypothetical protein
MRFSEHQKAASHSTRLGPLVVHDLKFVSASGNLPETLMVLLLPGLERLWRELSAKMAATDKLVLFLGSGCGDVRARPAPN